MILKVRGQPRYHPQRGFRFNTQFIQPAGEGSIKKAAELLQAQLTKEGLFDPARKRLLPYPPSRIGLITAAQSAAYADFIKIINARWHGVAIELLDVQVQGEAAPAQIVGAIQQFNAEAEPPEVLVLIRGGGSAEDLAAFSTEQVTRAVAASRVPTLVAIGHEVDISLAELAADQRASTPSNAAELLVPDRQHALSELQSTLQQLEQAGQRQIQAARVNLQLQSETIHAVITDKISRAKTGLINYSQLLEALNPSAILRRGYAIVRQDGRSIRSTHLLASGAQIDVQLADGSFEADVTRVRKS
jgi:exodeoxyribonuclease VII large subunit